MVSEVRVVLSAMLLAAGVAAAVAAGAVRLSVDEGPRIASVRLGELAAEHAADAARADSTAEETAATARAWALALEDALGAVAARNGAVLLPVRAVAAGAPDLTEEIRLALEDRLGRPGSEPRP